MNGGIGEEAHESDDSDIKQWEERNLVNSTKKVKKFMSNF